MLAGRSIWPASDTGAEPVKGRLPVAGAGHGVQWHEPVESPIAGQQTSRKERGALTEDRFDRLTQRLATASMSRRGAIGVIGGVFAGAVASTSFGIKPASAQPGQLPQQIYVIRHGERPPEPQPGQSASSAGPPFGVDVDGNRNAYSLSPRGWQRSGALTVLFSHAVGPKVGLRTPTALYATAYGEAAVTKIHRPYQTILGLSRRLGLPIQSPDVLGQEAAFTEAALTSGAEVVLICYEHHRIPALVQGIPTVDGTAIPALWPDDRYDVIWTFTIDPDGGRYTFDQVPQQLLDGDTDTVI
jgi:hypothetical protein